ncbi:MAG: N-succinylarginine dihydrolase [Polyangiaceae bacterium]
MTVEASFDALVGPTHSFAGLSPGNLAALGSRGEVSYPRRAALQGLAKMRLVRGLGVLQGLLPPQERPHLPTLRRLGFWGSDAKVIADVARTSPHLLAQTSSSSSMWAANAATVAPSADTSDGRVHIVVANLATLFHRSLEAEGTFDALARIFSDSRRFAVHRALPSHVSLGDEGAANHMRLAPSHGAPGLHVMVFGRSAEDAKAHADMPMRQAREASEAVARHFHLGRGRALFVKQSRSAIERGAFHNDVVATSNQGVLLYHEAAYEAEDAARLLDVGHADVGESFTPICVKESELPLDEAVRTYLFNGQILSLPGGEMALIAPAECEESAGARATIERILADESNPIAKVEYVDLRQSMKNGGGPACVRLRVALTEEERAAVHPACFFDEAIDAKLTTWIERRYRERLAPEDLADPKLLDESRTALDELTQILGLGALYEFQQEPGNNGD